MYTVSFSSIKGGCGKSSLTILTGNYLAQNGYRVLMIDLDIQNALSFYYVDDFDNTGKQNIARGLQEGLTGNIIDTNTEFIDILPSSLNLVDLRTVSERRLKTLLESIRGYDYCLIDTPPSYDNLVLNAINASDLIIIPVKYSLFDYKTAAFYIGKLETETDRGNDYRVLINFYRSPRTDNPDSELNQYISLFDEFRRFDIEIPETRAVSKIIDFREPLSKAQSKVKLYEAIEALSNRIIEYGKAKETA